MECPICLEDCSNESVVAMPCGHLSCEICLTNLKNICHSCRSPFQNNDIKKVYLPSYVSISSGLHNKIQDLSYRLHEITIERDEATTSLTKVKKYAKDLHKQAEAMKLQRDCIERSYFQVNKNLVRMQEERNEAYERGLSTMDALSNLVENWMTVSYPTHQETKESISSDLKRAEQLNEYMGERIRWLEGQLVERDKVVEGLASYITSRAQIALEEEDKVLEDLRGKLELTVRKNNPYQSPNIASPSLSQFSTSNERPTDSPMPKRKLSGTVSHVANSILKAVSPGKPDSAKEVAAQLAFGSSNSKFYFTSSPECSPPSNLRRSSLAAGSPHHMEHVSASSSSPTLPQS